jgi:hypothetical protein
VRDALAETDAPALDVLGDGDGDVGEEARELVVRQRRGGAAELGRRSSTDDRAHVLRRHRPVA